MALKAEKFVPSHEVSTPGAFPPEGPGLPHYKDIIRDDRPQDIDTDPLEELRNSIVVEKFMEDQTRPGSEEEEEWLQRLDDLEAQPVYNEAEPVVRKPRVLVFYGALTQRQRELMDEDELLDVMERGELVRSR